MDCGPVPLRRVFANLLGDATSHATETEVAVETQGRLCRITVDDNGPGIPEAERDAMFSPFYRVEASRNRTTGGTGLGLAIAKQILAAHSGTVEAAMSRLGGARLAARCRRT